MQCIATLPRNPQCTRYDLPFKAQFPELCNPVERRVCPGVSQESCSGAASQTSFRLKWDPGLCRRIFSSWLRLISNNCGKEPFTIKAPSCGRHQPDPPAAIFAPSDPPTALFSALENNFQQQLSHRDLRGGADPS